MVKKSTEYSDFIAGIQKILKADPKIVKAAMEQGKQDRAEERKAKKAAQK